MEKSKEKIFDEVRKFLNDTKLKQREIERKTGVSQPQISRFKNGEFKEVSENLKKICKYANIKITQEEKINNNPADNAELMEALRFVWDGTEVKAKAISKIIRDLKEFSK